MAAEVREPARVGSFLRELGCDGAAVETAERLLAAGGRAFESGWPSPRGVLVLSLAAAPDGRRHALVAAAGERALHDLLLALPRGERLCVRAGLPWNLAAMPEVLEGGPADDRADTFEGVKGSRQPSADDVADRPLVRRHPVVERMRLLGRADERARLGGFVVEGPTLVGRAIRDGLAVGCVVHRPVSGAAAAEALELARAAGIPRHRASDGLLGTLTPTRPLPDTLAAVHLRLRDATDMRAAGPETTILVAEGLQNPDNLGMVLRTADAAGVEAVVVAGDATDPLHRGCVRAARGAVGRIPIFRCADLPRWLATLPEAGFPVAGAAPHGPVGPFCAGVG